MSDCLFCQIATAKIPAELEYEDDEIVAFPDINPQAPVHLLVIPRRHISTLLDSEDSDTELLGRMQRVGVELARRHGLDESGFRLVVNCLEDGGQSVFHLHLHVLGGRVMKWPPG